MNQELIDRIFNGFNNLNALIIGDVMIDAYCWGKVDRISPEAPVPVVSVEKKENRMGGAANVALNIQSLGANPILCSVIGNDNGGKLFKELMKDQGMDSSGMISSADRVTTVKTRVISQHQQMLRIDEEITDDITSQEAKNLINSIFTIIDQQNIDVIIFEDYDKGVITSELIEKIVSKANQLNIPVTVDPKKKNFINYHNVDLFKPNLKELREGLKIDVPNKSLEELNHSVSLLKEKMNIKSALITLSEDGVFYFSESGNIVPAHIRNISDVSGAGDTVISVASLCLAQNLDMHLVASLSNLAGGLVCEKVGVVPIEKDLLKAEALRIS